MIRAAVFPAPNQTTRLQHFDEPTLEPGAVLLKTTYAEVCGTDIHLADGDLAGVPYPIIPGHISVGTVEQTGGEVRSVDGRPVLPGDMVTFLDVFGTCNNCWHCLVAKTPTRCPSRRVYGVTCSCDEGLLGGWSEKIYLKPGVKIVHLPAGMPALRFIAAGCALPTAIHAVERADIKLGDVVGVQGAGPVGLCAAIAARLMGARAVVMLDTSATRLKMAEHFGFHRTALVDETAGHRDVVNAATDGRGVDVCIEATGVPAAVKDGLQLTRDGGRYVVVGHYTDSGEVGLNPHLHINRKHIEIRGVWGIEFRHFYLAIQLLADNPTLGDGRARWEDMVGKIYGLDSVAEALEAVRSRAIVKAIIDPGSGQAA